MYHLYMGCFIWNKYTRNSCLQCVTPNVDPVPRSLVGADSHLCPCPHSASTNHCVRHQVCEEFPGWKHWTGEIPRWGISDLSRLLHLPSAPCQGSAICHGCFVFPLLHVRDQPFVTVASSSLCSLSGISDLSRLLHLPSAPCQGSAICHGCFVFPLLPVRDQPFVTVASSSLCSLSGFSDLSRLLHLPSAPCQGSAICHGCFVFPLLPGRDQPFVTVASSSICSLAGCGAWWELAVILLGFVHIIQSSHSVLPPNCRTRGSASRF